MPFIQVKSLDVNRTESFKTFLGYVAFSLVKRCAIRPGAMTLMKCKELANPVLNNDATTLVHVKGMVHFLSNGYVFASMLYGRPESIHV